MNFFNKKTTIAVHDGRFHADDVFAAATLSILLDGKVRIIRTRDEDTIRNADYVIDVGGIHDPSSRRFDHHQKGGAGTRENGVPYAAFGLVWKEYGATVAGSASAAEQIENKLVCSIDAADNGVETYTPVSDSLFPYIIQTAFSAHMPTWKENLDTDKQFLEAVSIAERILRREIAQATAYVEAKSHIDRIYKEASDKRILVLDRMYPWERILLEYPDVLFVVASRDGKRWKTEPTLVGEGFERKAYFPASWAGLRGEDLEKASGVNGATFCHNGRFIATGTSKEVVLKLAEIALKNL